ncbi:MAG: peptide-binding protein [Planctomycetota bacterium]
MNRHRGPFIVFVFLLLGVIVLLQYKLMRRNERFFEAIDRLGETITNVHLLPDRDKSSTLSVGGYGDDEGDWLIWAFRVEPKTLNPISVDRDIYGRWITVPYIFEPLLDYDHDRIRLMPRLAETYDISADGLEITFHLRKGVYFSDGASLTADDVVFTYETIMNPGVDAANIANLYVDVDHVEKVDDRLVKFYMKRPYFKALENLCFWDIGILPRHVYAFDDAAKFNRHISNPVGSGPYVFEKWEMGREVVLRRNENYWGAKPKIKKIIYRFIPNDIASVQALRAGNVDLVIPDPEQFAELQKDEQFNQDFYCLSYWNPGAPFYYIGWNQDTRFFSDRLVRLAMTHVIDRDKIVTHLLRGNARTITGPFYIYGPQNDPNIEPWPYDPARAARLLDQAGWMDSDGDGLRDKDGNPFRFKFMYSSASTFYQRLAKLIKDEAAKVGIEVVPDPYEWSVVITRLNDRNFEAMVMGWGGDILEDPYQLWHSSQIGNRGSNYVGFRNNQADELITLARRTMDDDQRNRLYHRLHRILHEQQPYTFLYARPTFRLLDRRFKNVIIHKLGLKYEEWYVPTELQKYK